MSDAQLAALERDILAGRGDTIPGTGGLKKIRCAVPGRGKRGGRRVVFADYPSMKTTVLIAAFPKNVKESLTRAERNELKRLKKMLDEEIGV